MSMEHIEGVYVSGVSIGFLCASAFSHSMCKVGDSEVFCELINRKVYFWDET